MTILSPQRMMFGRGVFGGANIVVSNQILVPDVTYLAHPGLTLRPDGVIEVANAGAGEWMFESDVSMESIGGTYLNVRVWVAYNGIEIPSTRRNISSHQNYKGTSATLRARLTNLIAGDEISLLATLTGGNPNIRVHPYGIAGVMEKVER